MKPLIINLAKTGAVLSTRERGREIADAVEAGLRERPGVVLNFSGVEIVTPSFLDEVLTRAAGVLGRAGSGSLVAGGITSEVHETLELVLRHRKMMLVAFDDERVELLGGTPQLQATLEAAQRLKSFTAPELAKKLGLKLPNLHQRLKALEEAGAVTKRPDASAKRGKRNIFETGPEGVVLSQDKEPTPA